MFTVTVEVELEPSEGQAFGSASEELLGVTISVMATESDVLIVYALRTAKNPITPKTYRCGIMNTTKYVIWPSLNCPSYRKEIA